MKKYFFLSFVLISSFLFSQNLKKEIKKITEGKIATVAVSILGFEDDVEVNVKGNDKLPMQSVFKFPIALAVLHQVDQGKLKLNQEIFISKKDLLENTWSPLRDKFPNGEMSLPLSEILRFTVSESDNNGCDILLRLIGGVEKVQTYMDQLGVKDFSIKFNEEEMHKIHDYQYLNYITTNSLSQLFKRFFENRILSKTSTDFLMKTLIETYTGKNRLVAKLPANAIVAHKTGTSFTENQMTAAINDAGIVTLPNGKHYAISVFVSDSNEREETNEKMIADISKVTWDYFNIINKNKK